MKVTQNKLTRRQFIRGTALAGAGVALAACAAPPAGAPAAPAAAPTTAAAAPAAMAPSGKITYWHHYTSESEMDGLKTGTEMFQTKYPDASVESVTVPNADFMAKFTLAVQGGGKPDTTMIAAERVPDMVGMGGLQDLTDRINAWDMKALFPDSRFTAATIDGKIYGVPSFMFVDWMYYRKDWFDEAGLQPPATFDEFYDAAVKLTDASKERWGFGMRGGAGGQGLVVQVIRAFGSPIVDDQGKAALDIKQTTDALDWYSSLHTKEHAVPPSVTNDSYRQIMEAFRTGKTGMVWHHTGSLAEVQGDLGNDGTKFMSLPRPKGPAVLVNDISPSYNGIVDPKNAETGWAWLTHWADKDTQIMLMEKTGYVPSNTEAAKDERIVKNPYYTAAFEALANGTTAPQFPGQPAWTGQVVLPVFQRILLGELTPAQGADEIATGLEEAIAGNLK
jgi:multiple sugar transport system substrate-binding protein